MIVGNDVVDLALASKQSNWRRRGFLDKIFTMPEHSYILNSSNPDLALWLLWSMKESAYKIFIQFNHEPFFAPLRFECKIKQNRNYQYEGSVSFDNIIYTTTSEYSSRCIFTVAILDNYLKDKKIIHEKISFSKNDYTSQHTHIYHAILKMVSGLQSKPVEHFNIKKNANYVPEIYFKKQKMNLSLSISHHGKYGAYVIY